MNRNDQEPPDRLVDAASACEAQGRHAEALELLERALRAQPASPKAWSLVGAVCQKLGKLGEAREAHEQAYRADPSNPDHLVNIASVALKQGDPDGARQCLVLALEMEPRLVAAHVNLALTWCVFGRLEDAEEELRLAVLFGFEDAGPILDRIDRLRVIRDEMLRKSGERSGTRDPGAA